MVFMEVSTDLVHLASALIMKAMLSLAPLTVRYKFGMDKMLKMLSVSMAITKRTQFSLLIGCKDYLFLEPKTEISLLLTLKMVKSKATSILVLLLELLIS